MLKLVVILLTMILLTGCATLAPKVGPKIAKAVNRYCLEPYQERLTLRSTVNDLIAPNSIRVYCANDPEETIRDPQ